MTNFTWTAATNGNWSDASNWMPNGAPDTGDDAFITSSGSYTVTMDGDFSPENLTFNDAGGILDIGSHQLGVDISTTFIAGTITMEGGAFFVGGNGMMTSAGATLVGWGAVHDAITGTGTVVAASNHTLEMVDEVADAATNYDVQANATLQLDDLSANNATFAFLGGTGNVTFQDNADFDRSTISGLVAGDSTDNATAQLHRPPLPGLRHGDRGAGFRRHRYKRGGLRQLQHGPIEAHVRPDKRRLRRRCVAGRGKS